MLIAGAVMVIVGQHRRPGADHATVAPAVGSDGKADDSPGKRSASADVDVASSTAATAAGSGSDSGASTGRELANPIAGAGKGPSDIEMVPVTRSS